MPPDCVLAETNDPAGTNGFWCALGKTTTCLATGGASPGAPEQAGCQCYLCWRRCEFAAPSGKASRCSADWRRTGSEHHLLSCASPWASSEDRKIERADSGCRTAKPTGKLKPNRNENPNPNPMKQSDAKRIEPMIFAHQLHLVSQVGKSAFRQSTLLDDRSRSRDR